MYDPLSTTLGSIRPLLCGHLDLVEINILIYFIRFKMSVVLVKKNCFKMNVTFSFNALIIYIFPIVPLNYYYALYFQSTTFYFNL